MFRLFFTQVRVDDHYIRTTTYSSRNTNLSTYNLSQRYQLIQIPDFLLKIARQNHCVWYGFSIVIRYEIVFSLVIRLKLYSVLTTIFHLYFAFSYNVKDVLRW